MEAKLIDGIGSINTDWQGVKQLAAEFCRAAPTATAEELDAGMKCFGLAWISCQFGDGFMDRIAKESEHPALMRIVNREFLKYRLPLGTDIDMS